MKQITMILAVMVMTAACNRPAADSAACASPPPVAERAASDQRAAALARPRLTPAGRLAVERTSADRCLQRWAYRLRGSDADLRVLKTAVLGACDAELARLADVAAALPVPAERPIADWSERRAVFYTVQARAGGCRGPAV